MGSPPPGDAGPPAAPINLFAAPSDSTLTVSCTDSTAGDYDRTEFRYQEEFEPDTGPWTSVSPSPTVCATVIGNLTNGVLYQIQARHCDTEIPSLCSEWDAAEVLATPSASSGGGMASSATAAGITWFFDGPYEVGYYPDGMPWVVENSPGAGVTITSVTPATTTAFGGVEVHGWEENPVLWELPASDPNCASSSKTCDLQSMDGRLAGTTRLSWASAPARWGNWPKAVSSGTSILKVISNLGNQNCFNSDPRTCIDSAAVLTVRSSAPPANAIRPPYPGTDKPDFVLTGFDIATDLPNLPLLTSGTQHTLADINAAFGNYSVSSSAHLGTEFDGRATPLQTTRIGSGADAGYGCDYGLVLNAALARIAQTGPAVEKEPIFYYLVNYGVDAYYASKIGKNWDSDGCIHHARKPIMMFAGQVLDNLPQGGNQTAANEMRRYVGAFDPLDGMTYRSTVTGEALWGDAPCKNDPTGNNATARHCDELRDGGGSKRGTGALGANVIQATPAQQIAAGTYSYAAYQLMSHIYTAGVTNARIYGFDDTWPESAFPTGNDSAFDYVDRINDPPWNGTCLETHCDDYFRGMYEEYGCETATCQANRGQ